MTPAAQHSIEVSHLKLLIRKGRNCAVLMGAVGVVLVLILSVILKLITAQGVEPGLPIPLVGMATSALLSAYVGGAIAARKVARGMNPYGAGLLLFYAVLCFTFSTLTVLLLKGDFSEIWSMVMKNGDLFGGVFLLATLPMSVLGLIWGAYLKRGKKMISQERVAHG